MAGKKQEGPPKSTNSGEARLVGTYVAYSASGDEIYRRENFVIGQDKVPGGVSIGMRAMRIVDTKTGEAIKTWNPWGVI